MIKITRHVSWRWSSKSSQKSRRAPVLIFGFVLFQLAFSSSARAVVVQGFAKTSAGSGVAQVQVDFVEATTGVKTRTTSNALGYYFVDVLAGTYEVRYAPSARSGLAALANGGVIVNAATTLPDVALPFGVLVTGTLVDNLGAPVVGADLNLVNQSTFKTAYTPGDNTDATGHFSVTVVPGVYDIDYRPPSATLLAPKQVPVVSLLTNTVLPTVTVMPGIMLTGTVVDSGGSPIFDVNLVFFDSVTRKFVYTTRDHTDALGVYSVIVEPGTYNIQFIPPVGALVAAQRLNAVSVSTNRVLPNVVLAFGIEVTGHVIDGGGAGVAGVNLNFFDAATGLGVFTPRDKSAADGSYRVVLPPGVYNVQYVPPAGGRLVPVRLADLMLPASMNLPDVVLVSGPLVSGNVLDAITGPVLGLDLNFFDSVSGAKVFTANDNTDALGHYSVAVPPGTYSIQYTPPVGTSFLPVGLFNVVVAGDLVLPDIFLQTGIALSATVVDGRGLPVPGVDVDVLDAASLAGIFLVHDTSDATGFFRTIIPAGNYIVQLQPPPASGFLPTRTLALSITSDIDLGMLTLPSGFRVTGAVVDSATAPLAGIDLDFVNQTTSLNQLLVGDATNTAGQFQVAVRGGTYRVQYEPLPATGLVSQEVTGVIVAGDTTLPTMTLRSGTRVSGAVVSGSRIPVRRVNTNWFVSGTCQPVFTANDLTNATGRFEVVLDPGIYDVNYKPPAGSGLFMRRRMGVVVGTTDKFMRVQTLGSTPVETEVCDGVDNDCDGLVDEGCSTPQVALDLQANSLTWQSVPRAIAYDVIRGDLGALRGTAGNFQLATAACQANDHTSTTLVESLSPPPAAAFWFLVRAVNAAGPESWGDATRDAGIGVSSQACP